MRDFSLQKTLESGQLFRWRYTTEGAIVSHANKTFSISYSGEVKGLKQAEASHFLREDQPLVEHKHPFVKEAIKNNTGLRVIRQDPWECLVTFIISQNNNIKRIQKNVISVTEKFGKPIEEGFYSFPLPHELGTEEEFRELGLGYRAKYLAELRKLNLKWLHGLKNLEYEEAKEELFTISGVGPKVADCVLLFSLGFDEACPEDTWIKKVFTEQGLTREDLGEQAGLIQQYLFHHARTS